MTDQEILRLEAVDFVRESRQILTGINLTVRAGERWALIGPNGAGKSTILSMCGAVKHPTRGSVHVLGRELGRVDIRELRESIGHVNPRHPLSSPLTVRQVILTGATGTTELMPRWTPDTASQARADKLIEMLGLAGLEQATWPTMSQGERGRALIARALLPDPPLLLLDEPSTGLDVAAREQFLSTVDHLHLVRPDLATILVTHHLEELPTTTTHAMLIMDGQVHAAGRAREILTTELVSECFDHPIEIEHRAGRWQARALVNDLDTYGG
ncbi:iron complex transport system ATP-binding protein [Antricoccus suffuscus]|uniref:Iron complex transport system ATP-binding protein n=1 Tax=Antricoccus suffuscus TaxID=1629062 RepID=A0A2T0ZXB9_9ACTN|nr:ATP-binding cassette domain-containing protein [Antricoccus suffuscus]PRZ41002.1 iron complex transport system ATP-binding protein [Antricoccus suffuscus]